jgi:hypothetical protein
MSAISSHTRSLHGGAPRRGHASSGRPTASEAFDEAAPVIGSPAVYGPPVIFLLGPWLILVLLLIPPAALLFTVALVVAVAAALLVAVGAVIASPYLLVRHLRGHQPAHAVSRVTAARSRRPVRQSVRARLVHLAAR